jgi:hypothetical protein
MEFRGWLANATAMSHLLRFICGSLSKRAH